MPEAHAGSCWHMRACALWHLRMYDCTFRITVGVRTGASLQALRWSPQLGSALEALLEAVPCLPLSWMTGVKPARTLQQASVSDQASSMVMPMDSLFSE